MNDVVPFALFAVLPFGTIAALAVYDSVKCHDTFVPANTEGPVQCHRDAKLEAKDGAILCICPKDGAK